MQNLDHLIDAIRQRLSERDLELLDLASSSYERQPHDAEEYDQVFDRVLARVQREEGPRLQRELRLLP